MAAMTETLLAKNRAEPVNKSSLAIYWFVAIGIFFTLLQIYIYGSAALAGDFMHRADPGPTPIPEWMRLNFMVQDSVWAIAIFLTCYVWVIHPLAKTRTLSISGLIWLGILSIFWQDPLENFHDAVFSYNTHAFNIGGWACHIPGWVSPNGCGTAEPLFWTLSFYVVWMVALLVFSLHMLSTIKSSNPKASTVKIIFWLSMLVVVFDIAWEMTMIATGYYHYGGLALSILPDTRFRFPIWEPVLVAFLFVVFLVPLCMRNDKGETWMERGLSRVAVSNGKKQWMRLFAFVGMMNIGYIVGYNGPIIFISLVHHVEWPASIQSKSYFTNGLCGEGTTYACGGSNVASPRRGNSIHIGPNGEQVIPPGTKVPNLVPLSRSIDSTN